MFTIHRPRPIGLISALILGAAAAGTSALTQVSASDSPAFACTDSSGGHSGVTGTVTSIRVAHHAGYDRLVIGFATSNGVPRYQIHRQASSTFTRDPSGQPVTLEGNAGIKVVLTGADITRGVPSDLKPELPEIREVANIGDFERVVSYGVGLHDQACLRVSELGSPSRLVIDVQTPPNATAAASPQAAVNPSSTTSVAVVPQALATTGHAASPSQSPMVPLALLLAGLLALAGGSLITVRYRQMRR